MLEAVFERIGNEWGELDVVLHSIASARKGDLRSGLLNCSAAGFRQAMDVTCPSFVRVARLAAP
jgi:enoyl-[acyl-carrier protein] reductase I